MSVGFKHQEKTFCILNILSIALLSHFIDLSSPNTFLAFVEPIILCAACIEVLGCLCLTCFFHELQ